MRSLVQEKVEQAVAILQEKEIDLWLTFARGTAAGGDPVLPLIYGSDLIWQSALILTRSGERIAIVGRFEGEVARRSGAYPTVVVYQEQIRSDLVEALGRLNPRRIALNYSLREAQADGLSYGMYLLLLRFLEGTPFAERIVSADEVTVALRGRKTAQELARLRAAIATTERIFDATFAHVRPGMREEAVGDFMRAQLAEWEVEPAWDSSYCPVVDAGRDSPMGLVEPGQRTVERGRVLRVDFGVKQDEYCSDLQRMVYFLAPGEMRAPEPVQRAFDTVVRAVRAAVGAMKPGVLGRDVDAVARAIITGAGYREYNHPTGHPIGRLVNDGGWGLAPEWPQYGDAPNRPLEAGNVYTVEPVAYVPGVGHVGVEENVVVTETGAEYLSTPQVELVLR